MLRWLLLQVGRNDLQPCPDVGQQAQICDDQGLLNAVDLLSALA